jgi:hypothetical protein
MKELLIFLFVMSCIFFIREVYLYIQSALKNRTLIDTEVLPYSLPIIRLLVLWICISYIITYIIIQN